MIYIFEFPRIFFQAKEKVGDSDVVPEDVLQLLNAETIPVNILSSAFF